MKTNEKVTATPNGLLKDELTAINQYMVHAEMAEDWGYEGYGKVEEKTAIDEMKHAEWLIARILFLGGKPVVTEMNNIRIGKDLPSMLENDRVLEQGGIDGYNAAIKVMVEEKDNGSKQLLETILEQEEGHIDYFEEQQGQIEQMGLPYYLTTIK
ncbi:MAG: bacterioferritin [Anaerolineaceae bacterium]|nr:bacterioferritin [Anaerolineaceae bacterium]